MGSLHHPIDSCNALLVAASSNQLVGDRFSIASSLIKSFAHHQSRFASKGIMQ